MKSLLFIILAVGLLMIGQVCATRTQSLDGDTGDIASAKMNGIYFDYGIDSDRNGLLEGIAMKVGINVFSAGNYTLHGSLCSLDGKESIFAINQSHLGCDSRSVKIAYMLLKFYGSNASGPRYLKNLTLYDSNGRMLGQIDRAYLTKAYTNLEPVRDSPELLLPVVMNGNFGDRGVDINNDHLYDYLEVDIGIDVNSPGEYNLMGSIYDLENQEITWAVNHEEVSLGSQTLHLYFDGKGIRGTGKNGPYMLGDVIIFEGSSDSGLRPDDASDRVYTTSSYNYTDFAFR